MTSDAHRSRPLIRSAHRAPPRTAVWHIRKLGQDAGFDVLNPRSPVASMSPFAGATAAAMRPPTAPARWCATTTFATPSTPPRHATVAAISGGVLRWPRAGHGVQHAAGSGSNQAERESPLSSPSALRPLLASNPSSSRRALLRAAEAGELSLALLAHPTVDRGNGTRVNCRPGGRYCRAGRFQGICRDVTGSVHLRRGRLRSHCGGA